VSHLHIPDGVLPTWLWAGGLALALVLLVLASRVERHESRQQLAYRAAIGALVLAAMAIEIPFGPLEYHLTLVGPVGILLGPAAAFQVMFVASMVLAFLGHGGFTVIGLNALILGAGAAVARPIYRAIVESRSPAFATATAAAFAHAISGSLWLMTTGTALQWKLATHSDKEGERLTLFAAVAIPMWLVGMAVESTVAYGIGRFLTRVRPDLLPASAAPITSAAKPT